jgi:hypothetical protein
MDDLMRVMAVRLDLRPFGVVLGPTFGAESRSGGHGIYSILIVIM